MGGLVSGLCERRGVILLVDFCFHHVVAFDFFPLSAYLQHQLLPRGRGACNLHNLTPSYRGASHLPRRPRYAYFSASMPIMRMTYTIQQHTQPHGR